MTNPAVIIPDAMMAIQALAAGAERAALALAEGTTRLSDRAGPVPDGIRADAARTLQQRKAGPLGRLKHDTDAWVATADPGSGTPCMVPLSFLWDGSTVLIATAAASPAGRNLQAAGKVRLGIGPARDLVLIEGAVQAVTAAADIPAAAGDAFAVKTGFDPRELTDAYACFRIRPRRVQAWREVNELAGRDLMRDGDWVTR